MGKFSGRGAAPTLPKAAAATSFLVTDKRQAPVVNPQGGAGFVRDAKSELYTLAVAYLGQEGSFYEMADERDRRFRDLVRQLSQADPGWVARLVPYLRDEMQMRTASVVVAAEFARAVGQGGTEVRLLLNTAGVTVRRVVDSACQRADEPAELLGYWLQQYGRTVPSAVKRGLSDAAARLYTERATLKYDGQSRVVRMGDVLELCHAKPKAAWQSDLYRWLLDTRHKRARVEVPASLPMVGMRAHLESLPVPERRALVVSRDSSLDVAGMTWEALSGWLQGPMDAAAWEAVIPSMGYMALLRNLRNFLEQGVSHDVLGRVLAKLQDPEEVARSRQLPFRFLSAYKAAGDNLAVAVALENALQHSLANVPALTGRTLVLLDWSGSMFDPVSERSALTRAEQASLFGFALARRAEHADVYAYGSTLARLDLVRGASLLTTLKSVRSLGGTDTAGALRTAWHQGAGRYDRVLLVTDEQTGSGWGYGRTTYQVGDQLPARVPLYTWNLAGYAAAHTGSGPGRHTFAGLSDRAFDALARLEAGESQGWPF